MSAMTFLLTLLVGWLIVSMIVGARFNTSIKWNSKEVRNPIGRSVLAGLIFFLSMVFFFVILPFILALHPLFWILGQKGTYRRSRNSLAITLDRESFRRR